MELTLDWFKKECKMIHFFGLGFVQLKVSENERYHFYHPDFGAFTEDPHDHRYNFVAEVLKGTIKHTLWQLDEHPTSLEVEVRYESCNKDTKDVPSSYSAKASMIGIFPVSAGQKYFFDKDTFHQVERVGEEPLVTKLIRQTPTKEHARILVQPDKESICPFSGNLPEEELWRIVKDCL